MTRSHQATAAMNGFEFQKYAGIYLMLRYFDSFKTLKIEGESQDVEIEKDNGVFLFIQAKATEKPYEIDGSTAKERFKEALKSFKDTKTNGEKDSLVYINNFEQQMPFGIQLASFSNPYYLTYKELPDFIKEKIDAFSGIEKINKEQLVFAGLSFYGDDPETKTKQIHEKLKETLASIDPNLIPQSRLILDTWSSQFSLNGTSKTNKITKDSVASDLTFFALEGTNMSDETRNKLDISEEDYYEATSSFRELIEKKGLGFKEYNAINKIYNDARSFDNNKTIADCIKGNMEKITNILELDDCDAPDSIKKTVAKIIAFKLITRSARLRDIYNKLRNE